MVEMPDWLRKLEDDLIEQFRGRPNIAVFQKAVARQLGQLHAFFYQLYTLQWLDRAEGAQLDGIGNIVDLSRTDALVWQAQAGQYAPMDDGLYRLYLWFKIFLNTSQGTYGDVTRTLAKFWPHSPFRYSEHIEIPATMFFTTDPLPIWETDLRVLQIVTRVKAAGVALHFIIPTPTEDDATVYFATSAGVFLRQYIVCDAPEWPADTDDFHAAAPGLYAREHIIVDGTPLYDDVADFSAGAGAIHTRKNVIVDNTPLSGEAPNFDATATSKFVKEVHEDWATFTCN